MAATVCGAGVALLYIAESAVIGHNGIMVGDIAKGCAWRVFVFAVLSTIGAIITELKLPEPDLR